jgi:hypothetical protein
MVGSPFVTEVREPTSAILFNEKGGPEMVGDMVSRMHAFVDYEVFETKDEDDRPAFLLLIYCETATPEDIDAIIGSRLPDYIVARRFPISRIAAVRKAAGS